MHLLLISQEFCVNTAQEISFPDDEDGYAVSRSITQTSTAGGSADLAGYTTYQLSLDPVDPTGNVYAVYGDSQNELSLPPAFQVAPPFGANLGGTNHAFWEFKPEAEYDSWLTAGITDAHKPVRCAIPSLIR